MRNTLENIEKDCAEPGWYSIYNGRPNEAITHDTIMKARVIEAWVPPEMELFPCPDGSVQWEDDAHTLEVYVDKYKFDDEEMTLSQAIQKLESLKYNEEELKLTIKLPKEFRANFQGDRFKDSFFRLETDIKKYSPSSMSGNYELELVEALREAFQNAEVVK